MATNNNRRKFIRDISLASSSLYLAGRFPSVFLTQPKLATAHTAYIFDKRPHARANWKMADRLGEQELKWLSPVINVNELEFISCCAVTAAADQFAYFPYQMPVAHHLIYSFKSLTIHQTIGDLQPAEIHRLPSHQALDNGILLLGESKQVINLQHSALFQLNHQNHLIYKKKLFVNEAPDPSLSMIGRAALKSYFLLHPNGNRVFHYPLNYVNLQWDATKKRFADFDDANQFLTT